MPTRRSRTWIDLALVLGVCAAVYWPWLGAGGLTASEGHRAVPAWGMLESGDWLVPRMFGQVYLRKPPGVQWAIAGSSAVLGQTEFAARAVSAAACTLMGVVAWWFARRWFGRGGAVAAGVAQALMPWMWTVGRHAEIEAVHTLAVQVACLGVVDALLGPRHVGARNAAVWASTLGLGLGAMLLTKGPAGLPALGGGVLGACVVRRSWRPLARARLWTPVGLGLALAGGLGLLVLVRVRATGEEVVWQSAGEFLYTPGRLLGVAALAPGALIAMLPASLGLLFAWGPDARAEAAQSARARRAWIMAGALTGACLLSLGLYTVMGVSNVRYAMPSSVYAPPLAAYVLAGMWGRGAGAFTPARRAIARAMVLGHPAVLATVLIAGAWAWIATGERALRAKSGREAGLALSNALAGEAEGTAVWADDLVEARPEVLWTARRGAGRGGDVRWVPGLGANDLRLFEGVAVLRTDAGSSEGGLAVELVKMGKATELHAGRVDEYSFIALRVGGPPRPVAGHPGP